MEYNIKVSVINYVILFYTDGTYFYRYYDFYWNPRHHRILVLYNGVLELHTCTRVNSRYIVLIYFI
jgi:hypothetical protein